MESIDGLFNNTISFSDLKKQFTQRSMDPLDEVASSLDKRSEEELEEIRKREEKIALMHSAEFGIRDSVRSQVEDVAWLKEIEKQLEADEKIKASSSFVSKIEENSEVDRCAVCTLPVGSCRHTSNWMQSTLTKKIHEEEDDEVQRDIDGVLGVLDSSGPIKLSTKPQQGDIDLECIRWSQHTPRMADKIGDTLLPLSMPTERGWHTMTQVGKYTVLFGGVRFKDHRSPEPFTSVVPQEDVEYLCDLFVYDSDNVSWHKVNVLESTNGDNLKWPCGRYGHTACGIDKYHMLLFGGRAAGGRYLSDTWIFSLLTLTWRRLHCKDLTAIPEPRAFSACALSPSTRMVFLYGGTNGMENFGDVWTLQWGGESFSAALEDTVEGDAHDSQRHSNSERHHNNLSTGYRGDMHKDNPMAMGTLGAHSKELYWSRAVTVSGGVPPEPRYGHRLVSIPGKGRTRGRKQKHLRDGTFLALIGGCTVSPQEEVEARGQSALPPEKLKELMDLSQQLQAQYLLEGDVSENAGEEILQRLSYIEKSIGMSSTTGPPSSGYFDIKSVHRRAAEVTGVLAAMERETRLLEAELASTWYDTQAMAMNTKRKGARQHANLSVHFLCADDVAWVPQINPRISGLVPSSRMSFGAVALGDFIFVIGGVRPTSLQYSSAEPGSLVIHALDVTTLVWSEPKSMETTDYLDGPLRVADNDIARAKRRVETERSRGLSLGAREGVTVEFMEAEAILNVCRWRKQMLLNEQSDLLSPPNACFGMDGCIMGAAGNPSGFGNRAIFHGGWNFGGIWGGINHQVLQFGDHENLKCKEAVNCCIVLDLEQEMERRRRLEEEFHAKLERDRIENEKANFQRKVQSLFELREVQNREAKQQAVELEKMALEDYISSLPPLSLPPKVRLVKANEHTLWLWWPEVRVNSYGRRVEPSSITYYLYMAGGFETLQLGDRVLCSPPGKKPSSESAENHMLLEPSDSEEEDDEASGRRSSQVQCFRGEIIGMKRGLGLFTVKGDLGYMARDVPRSSLQLLRAEEGLEEALSPVSRQEKVPKRLQSYRKAQAVARRQQEANAKAAKDLGNQMDLKWKLIYEGKDPTYVVQNLVPQYVIDSERGATCSLEFCLRTVGADFPPESFSLMGPVSEFSTCWQNEAIHEERERMHTNKARKDVISVTLKDQHQTTVQIERWNCNVYGEGISDAYV